jgi:hypothetical protein
VSDRSQRIESQIMRDESLFAAVESLGVAIAALVRQSKSKGDLVARAKTFILRPNFNLHYTVDPSVMNFGRELIEEEVWEHDSQSKFFEGALQKLPEFKAVESLLEHDPQNAQFLRGFVLTVARNSLLSLNRDPLPKLVQTLLRDISKEPQDCRIKIWLTGISLKPDSMAVSDSLALMRPHRGDLQEKVTEESAHYSHAFQPDVHFSCLADLRLSAAYPRERQQAVEKLVLALRLFRLGAVASPMYSCSSESFDPFANFTMGSPGRVGREVYTMTLEDTHALRSFLDTISPLLPTSFQSPESKRDYFSIALYWYGEALLATIPPEGVIASAVACLEALFLENVQTEMAYRLGTRVSGFLRCFGLAPLDTQALVKQAYDVRSKYVHGDDQDKKWTSQVLLDLSRSILGIARLSLVAFSQMKDQTSRRELLALVDNALLDDRTRNELVELCARLKFCTALA